MLLLAPLGWLGCNAIAGIETGQLASSPAEEGGTSDVTTADRSTAGEGAAGEAGQGADASEGGAVADVVHDGPQYAAPTETTANLGDAAGSFNLDPALVVGGGGAVVTLDAIIGGGEAPGYIRSTNGAVSFASPVMFPSSGAVTSAYGYPSIARDSTSGNVYVAALGDVSSTGLYNQIAFLTSTNGGTSFGAAVNAADPALAASDFTDTPAIAVDNAAGGGQGALYITYTRYGATADLHVSSYIQGSFGYVTPMTITSPDQASTPVVCVGPNHYVYVAYYGVTANDPYVGFLKSTDQASTFGAAVHVAPLHIPFVAGAFNGNLGLEGVGSDGGATPVGLYSSPQIAANPVSGNLYVAYTDATQGADKANIYFSHSEDGGTTWSAPVQVNDDTTTNDQFLAAIAVSPDGTRLAIDFYDRRNDPSNLAAYRYGATATISGATVTFDPNFKVSPSQFPLLTYQYNAGLFSIHTGMAVDSTYFYDSFSQAEGSNLNVEVARYGILY
jgi:hypothetical protein